MHNIAAGYTKVCPLCGVSGVPNELRRCEACTAYLMSDLRRKNLQVLWTTILLGRIGPEVGRPSGPIECQACHHVIPADQEFFVGWEGLFFLYECFECLYAYVVAPEPTNVNCENCDIFVPEADKCLIHDTRGEHYLCRFCFNAIRAARIAAQTQPNN